jgi:hypothetical protein
MRKESLAEYTNDSKPIDCVQEGRGPVTCARGGNIKLIYQKNGRISKKQRTDKVKGDHL